MGGSVVCKGIIDVSAMWFGHAMGAYCNTAMHHTLYDTATDTHNDNVAFISTQ